MPPPRIFLSLVSLLQTSPATVAARFVDFAGKIAKNSVTISADTSSIELPLPLNNDNEIEQDERFFCFFTSADIIVRSGRVSLTVIDDDKGKCIFTESQAFICNFPQN